MTAIDPTPNGSSLPTTKLMALTASGDRPMAIIPRTFEDCYRLAKLLAGSGLVPRHYQDKPDACCVAILHGLEIGLPPMQAIQCIAVQGGKPSLDGNGKLAVVRASGLLESFDETDDGTTATCRVRRRGDKSDIVRTFSMADAQRAGLATRDNHKSYPARMRLMRARGYALSDGFPDVLKGMGSDHEYATNIELRDVTPAHAPAAIVPPEPPEPFEPPAVTEPELPPDPPSEMADEMEVDARGRSRPKRQDEFDMWPQ